MRNILWKRTDQEGHDACRFARAGGQSIIEGRAAFRQGPAAAGLAYRLVCDSEWRSLQASVTGWIGERDIGVFIQGSQDGSWCVNGETIDGLAGLQDVDLGFTPASNTNAILRLNLRVGDEAETTAVWLDTDDWTVKRLPQAYRRIDSYAYEYRSPLHDFRTILLVEKFGVVVEYPGLWIARSIM